MTDSANRFTQTVQDYVKYRPSYPKEVIDILVHDCGLKKNHVIADIGSGTGFLAKLFLDFGNKVYGIEPNDAMRGAASDYLKSYSKFEHITGTAEQCGLNDESVDFVVAGTAFHWFDPVKSKLEFQRILKKPGFVLLIWNVRNIHSDLVRAYENLIIEYGKDYRDSAAQQFDKTAVKDFFKPFEMHTNLLKNSQTFDWIGFQGRLLSTSYSLRPEDTGFEEMMHELKKIFDRYQVNNQIEFMYDTKLYYGRLK